MGNGFTNYKDIGLHVDRDIFMPLNDLYHLISNRTTYKNTRQLVGTYHDTKLEFLRDTKVQTIMGTL